MLDGNHNLRNLKSSFVLPKVAFIYVGDSKRKEKRKNISTNLN